jgi:hypothetical protein
MSGFAISYTATFCTTLILLLILFLQTNRSTDFTFTHSINAFPLFNYTVFSNYDTENIVFFLASALAPDLGSVI